MEPEPVTPPLRLDREIAARGLAPSRVRAQALIEAGLVTVDGAPAEKASQPVSAETVIAIHGQAMPYVGRGGMKLEAALRHFRINASGTTCLDVGASTGGFTDCLLQRGAARVVAIDVGHGQMVPALAADPRVELREGVNARYMSPEQFDTAFDLATVDVSFISLTLVLPSVAPLVRAGGHIVALVKPEFELGRGAVDRKGVIRSEQARWDALKRVLAFCRGDLGLEVRGTMRSPLVGGSGNREFLACLRIPASGAAPPPDESAPGSGEAGDEPAPVDDARAEE